METYNKKARRLLNQLLKEQFERANRPYEKNSNSIIYIFLNSCHSDTNNVIVEGQVSEAYGKPIGFAAVLVMCWSYGNTPDGSYTGCDSATVSTDSFGNYSCRFDKGAFVEVIVSKPNYDTRHEAISINGTRNVIDIELTKK